VTNIYGCLLNSENRISDIRNQPLRALNSTKKVKDLINSSEFFKTLEKLFAKRFDPFVKLSIGLLILRLFIMHIVHNMRFCPFELYLSFHIIII
jgi:hypothetical protein